MTDKAEEELPRYLAWRTNGEEFGIPTRRQMKHMQRDLEKKWTRDEMVYILGVNGLLMFEDGSGVIGYVAYYRVLCENCERGAFYAALNNDRFTDIALRQDLVGDNFKPSPPELYPNNLEALAEIAMADRIIDLRAFQTIVENARVGNRAIKGGYYADLERRGHSYTGTIHFGGPDGKRH